MENTDKTTPDHSEREGGGERTADEAASERSRRPTRLGLLALAVATTVAAGTYAIAASSSGSTQAVASLALDEREVGWPFYGAAQEKAAAFFDDGTLVATIDQQIEGGVETIDLRRPGDLSLLEIIATADDGSVAVAAADAATGALLDWSRTEQRGLLDDELFLASDLVDDLEVAVAASEQSLRTAEDDAERIRIEAELSTRSAELVDARIELEAVERQIEATGPEFRVITTAQAVPHRVPTLFSALATGAGAGLLAVLAVPIFSRRR